MKVKICGITRLEDAMLAVDVGVWAVGFIFAKNTPRYITPEDARNIIDSLPDNMEKVGVFVDCLVSEVLNISKLTGITKIQLHGSEPPEYCSNIQQIINKEVIKAIQVRDIEDLIPIKQYKGNVSYILLDTFCENQRGGTGKTFDWVIAKEAKGYNIPIILAGGLNPENILTAYQEVMPFALDLSSGVEVSKGIKDCEKLKCLKNIIGANRAVP
ncbi:MAG: hypothetical protein A2Y25_03740 [Candidatus Melainabacteria bacterium GWF2_37_15]|nr:MAG: hypothetical protein A2Y25_03740 [Candidatus Melainabacteria bacterium GWF2_37_15]